MPYSPQFGGTNGVTELDIGQAGSPTLAAGNLSYAANVRVGRASQPRVINAIPKQEITFVEDLGWQGQIVTWSGLMRIKDLARWQSLYSNLNFYTTGSEVASGVRGSYEASTLAPTKLVDTLGLILSTTAIMIDYQLGGRIQRLSGDPNYTYATQLSLIFRMLA